MTADLLVLTGPPGAGKTTVAGRLAAQCARGVHLSADPFWHAIVAGGIDPVEPGADVQNRVVIGAVAAAAAAYATGGFTTVVDGIVGPWMLERFRSALPREVDERLDYVVLRPARDVALRRAQSRTGPADLVVSAPILRMWDAFADVGDLESHVVDTGEETVDRLAAGLEDGRWRLSGAGAARARIAPGSPASRSR